MENFRNKGLNEEILSAIEEMGFEEPTPIQEKTIPAILNSKNDLIALAQTGTGKTAAFGLPIIQQIVTSEKVVQSLMLCPTRELCLQIAKELSRFSKNIKNLSVVPVYGGANASDQIRAIKKGAQIIVGTPGRTLDLINRKALRVENVEYLVLDEADEMLNMGFKEDLDAILAGTPADKQTLLFSATMPQGVMQIAERYMNSPQQITVGKRNTGASSVEHKYYMVKASDKYLALKRLADINPEIYGIVFCRTRQETKDIASKLLADGYNADALHGDLSQAQRDHVMQRFRVKNLQLLIATDVAARGIDVNDLTHIINYNLPDDPEVYVHRSGRTGRAGKKGLSIAITHSREGGRLRDIQRLANIKFEHALIPNGKEICEKRLYSLIDKVNQVEVDNGQIESFLTTVYEKFADIDREEIIKRFVSVEFNHFLEYYKNSGDINVSKDDKRSDRKFDGERRTDRRRDRGERGDRSDRGSRNDRRDRNLSRFFINIGTKDKLQIPNLIGLINERTSTRDIEIGKIEILKSFSFFEADKAHEALIIKSLNDTPYGSAKLVVELSTPKKNAGGRDGDNGGFKRNDDRKFDGDRRSSSKKRPRSRRY